ncbi:rhodanese-like domain-containing protein [candidate division KSB1 bacterium]|nr:rhodanese-like domain-containing protein [candidate division KSB1 bacterium]
MKYVFGFSIIFLLTGFPFAGCEKNENPNIHVISADSLNIMLQDKDFTLVNVHIPYDGEIPQTDLFIPYNEIKDHLEELPPKDSTIVLYCRSDRMSGIAANTLENLGYSKLYNVKGGMRAWKSAGFDLIRKH